MTNGQKLLIQAGYNPAHIHWPYLYWGSGIDSAVKHYCLIAEDHGYTFKMTDQRFNPDCKLPHGPVNQRNET